MSLVITRGSAVVTAILAPIDPDAPAGLFDVEDETYQAIDLEMVKLGGLHERSIDWVYVEEASQLYLAGHCKQMRILGHLITAWLRSKRWEQWSDAFAVLVGMVERYWESSYPKPGPTGYLGKRKQVNAQLERLIEALRALDSSSRTDASMSLATHNLRALERRVEDLQLDMTTVARFQQLLDLQRQQVVAATEPTQCDPPLHADQSITQAFFSPSKPIAPVLGNERETRRALLAMADHVNVQDPYDSAGYLLRRFALWGALQGPPPLKKAQRTELPAVPQEIADVYEDALHGRGVEPVLLQRIEKSVVASPFWIRGSYLASGIADRLAMQDVAEAIRQASNRFVTRIPALLGLSFSDGTAFVDDQTRAWLCGTAQVSRVNCAVQEYGELRETLATLLNHEGIEAALLQLQKLQAQYSSPRQRCQASVIAGDLLSARGVTWLAQDLYVSVARTMEGTSARDWEPDLYRRMERP